MSATEKTKAFSLFANRIKDAKYQIQGIDACIGFSLKHLKAKKGAKAKIGKALGVSTLNIPIEQSVSFANRLRKNNYEYTFHVLYRYFSEYLKNLLTEMYDRNPLQVVGKVSGSMAYHDIVKLGSYDAIKTHIVNEIFKQLEATRSTSQLLKKILSHTTIEMPDNIVKPALMYIEVRHLHVHNSGLIDKDFVVKYKDLISIPIEEGNKFVLNKGFALDAIQAVYTLVEYVDREVSLRSDVSTDK